MFSREVVNEIPFFSHGEGHIVEKISGFPLDEEGMKRMWDWHDHLSQSVLDLLREGLVERDASICRDLHMSSILEKVTRRQSEYDYYTSLMGDGVTQTPTGEPTSQGL